MWVVFTLGILDFVYRHVVNNSAIAVWIIYSVLNSKLITIRNIDDEPRISEYAKSALLIYIRQVSQRLVRIKTRSNGGDVKLFLCKVRKVA